MTFADQVRAATTGADPDGPTAAGVPAEDGTSEAIIDGALRQFELFGFARSTMEDIARRSNVARVTLYRRFPGKTALIQAVMLRELQRFVADLDAAVGRQTRPQDRVAEGFSFALGAIREHRLLQRMLESEPEAIIGHFTSIESGFVQAARAYLVALVRDAGDDVRSQEELDVVADVVVRLLVSFMLTPPELIDVDDPATTRAFALRYIAPMLVGSGPARQPAE